MPAYSTQNAVVLGRAQGRNLRGEKVFYTWIKLPDLWPTRILTFRTEDELIPWGLRTAEEIVVKVDPEGLEWDGYYYTADLEFLDVRQQEGETS